MYRPRKNTLIYRFFSWYIQFIINKDFATFNYDTIQLDKDAAVLILANHFSWWDGFLIFCINKKVFRKQFHVLVNADNYNKISFLKYLGAFAAERGGNDILKTLNYAGQLLENPDNLVLVFPQGRLFSNHIKNIAFEKGAMHIINACEKKINLVFAATFIDFFSKRKASAFTYLYNGSNDAHADLQLLKTAYNKHYDNAAVKHTKITG